MKSAFSFFPDWPLVPDAVLWVGLALLVAGLCGEWCFRVWRLPRVSGYGLIGLLAGSAGLQVLSPGLISDGRLVVDMALGLLLFELGSRFSLRWVRNNPWIVLTSLLESILTFFGVMAALVACGASWMTSVTVAGISMATSPAMVIQLRNEFKSEGQVTERLMTLATLNSVYAVVVVKIASGWFHQAFYGNTVATLLQVGYLLLGSILLALLLAWSCNLLYSRLPAQNEHSFVMLFGLVLLAIALAHLFKLSTILSLLIAGVVFKNVSARPRLWEPNFGTAGWLLTVVLFVLTTITFEWHDLVVGGGLALVVIVVRGLSKTVGVVAFARSAGIGWKKGVALGISLSPMSALAFVLMDETYAMYPHFDPMLRAIVMCAIVFLQILSPILMYRALSFSNEIKSLS